MSQELLRAILFEPGPWVPADQIRQVDMVPMRMTALQKREKVIERLMKANAKEDDSLLLGTASPFWFHCVGLSQLVLRGCLHMNPQPACYPPPPALWIGAPLGDAPQVVLLCGRP